jgi:hypothetical protein
MPASGKIQGVIVYFDGGPGEDPVQEGAEYDTLTYYLSQNYGVVQLQWSLPWESTYQTSPLIPASIQNGECRPATLQKPLERGMKSGTRRDASELFTDNGSDPGSQKLDRP